MKWERYNTLLYILKTAVNISETGRNDIEDFNKSASLTGNPVNMDVNAFFEKCVAERTQVLQQENDRLKEENRRIPKLERAISNLTIEKDEIKQENDELREKLKFYEESQTTEYVDNGYIFDLTHFTNEWVANKFIEKLFSCSNYKLRGDTYLIDCATAVIPLYKVITQSPNIINSMWNFKGTIEDFVFLWNDNVVPLIEDAKRRKKLTINEGTFKTELTKDPWKESSPDDWRDMIDTEKGAKKKLERAYNIRHLALKLFR